MDTISRTFLLLIDHIAHHHLKRLHRDIDRGVEEHQREQAEPHSGIQSEEQPLREREIASIGQQQHHSHRDDSAHKQIGLTTTEATPRAIRILTDNRLHNHTHQRRKDPEEREGVRVGTEGCKNARDVSTLKRISNLNAEEAGTQIEELKKRSICTEFIHGE